MLTDEQIKQIAANFNEKINVPFVPEETEGKLITEAIKMLDDKIAAVAVPLIQSILKERLPTAINEKLDLPFLNEEQEQALITIAINYLIDEIVKTLKR